MKINIITCSPKLIKLNLNKNIIKKAIKNKIVEIYIHDIKKYSNYKNKKIDCQNSENSNGMVLMTDPIINCINKIKKKKKNYNIYTSPDGKKLTQKLINKISLNKSITIISGKYKGIDKRIRKKKIHKEISIGNYVLSGGELAIAILLDSIIRLLPGVLKNKISALTDSFQNELKISLDTYVKYHKSNK